MNAWTAWWTLVVQVAKVYAEAAVRVEERREAWEVGDRCYLKGGFWSRDNAAATKMHPGKVIEVLRGACRVRLDTGRETTARFNLLEHDEHWLAEQDQREMKKRARVESELRLVEEPEPVQRTLTFTLADKLQAEDRDEDACGASDQVRQDALAQLAALKAAPAAAPPPPAPPASPPPPPPPPPPDEPELEPEPEPEPPPPPPPPAAEDWREKLVAQAEANKPKHPMQALLKKVEDELATLYEEQERLTQANAARTPFSVTNALTSRADALLVPLSETDLEGPLDRARVLTMALEIGLAALEKKHKVPPRAGWLDQRIRVLEAQEKQVRAVLAKMGML